MGAARHLTAAAMEPRTAGAAPEEQIVTAIACILHGDEVLLGRRESPGMSDIDGRLDLPGGKVEFGESPEQAVAREVLEETGLTVEVETLVPLAHANRWAFPDRTLHAIVLCYLCRLAAGQPEVIDAERYGRWTWTRLAEVDPATTLRGVDRFLRWVLDHRQSFPRAADRST